MLNKFVMGVSLDLDESLADRVVEFCNWVALFYCYLHSLISDTCSIFLCTFSTKMCFLMLHCLALKIGVISLSDSL